MADTYTKARLKEKDTTNFLHPETEVDQIKKTGGTGLASIITTLLKAATTSQARAAIESAAATHAHSSGDITNFASDVVSAIGEETLAALGVRYSITTNGYICFGQLFGGLILQWEWSGGVLSTEPITKVTLPISFTNDRLCALAIDHGGSLSDVETVAISTGSDTNTSKLSYVYTTRFNLNTKTFRSSSQYVFTIGY